MGPGEGRVSGAGRERLTSGVKGEGLISGAAGKGLECGGGGAYKWGWGEGL